MNLLLWLLSMGHKVEIDGDLPPDTMRAKEI